ncbi:MAG: DUF2974 domain-containing protein [Spirochaetaceae bacterium]|nr:DUF2974 domain-containing protein [Spirochaetaceae bacterium]
MTLLFSAGSGGVYMANIFDYLEWRGDIRQDQIPFNTVDYLILSRISYLPFDGIVPDDSGTESITIGEAAELFAKLRSGKNNPIDPHIIWHDDIPFIAALGKSPRFSGLKLTRYVNIVDTAQEKQFSALTILGCDNFLFVSFRGTDNTIVGWKEDFNMSFLSNIPAQKEAVEYLNGTARAFSENMKLGGHSKGGNLAIYAASFCGEDVRSRITDIYTQDSPGFCEDVLSAAGYLEISGRIHAFVPQGSVVGMLFGHTGNYTVVKSTEKGILQHDIYSWEVIRDDMVRLETVTKGSTFMDKTMNEWITGLTPDQRRQFSDTIYTMLTATDSQTLQELTSSRLKNAIAMVRALRIAGKSDRAAVGGAVTAFLKAARDNMKTLFPEREKKKHKPSVQAEADRAEGPLRA